MNHAELKFCYQVPAECIRLNEFFKDVEVDLEGRVRGTQAGETLRFVEEHRDVVQAARRSFIADTPLAWLKKYRPLAKKIK